MPSSWQLLSRRQNCFGVALTQLKIYKKKREKNEEKNWEEKWHRIDMINSFLCRHFSFEWKIQLDINAAATLRPESSFVVRLVSAHVIFARISSCATVFIVRLPISDENDTVRHSVRSIGLLLSKNERTATTKNDHRTLWSSSPITHLFWGQNWHRNRISTPDKRQVVSQRCAAVCISSALIILNIVCSVVVGFFFSVRTWSSVWLPSKHSKKSVKFEESQWWRDCICCLSNKRGK